MKISIKREQNDASISFAEREKFGTKFKTFRLFSMAALALTMAACTNDDNEIVNPAQPAEAGVVHFKATVAAPNSGATTRTAYTEITEGEDAGKINVAWKAKEDGGYEGDKIAMIYNSKKYVATVTAVDGSGNATIEADITDLTETDNGCSVHLIYPAAAVTDAGTLDTDYLLKAQTQNGTLGYIQDWLDAREGYSKWAVNGTDVTLKENVKMPSIIAIWKLKLQDNAATPNALAATEVAVKIKNDESTNLVAKATSTGKSEYTLCLIPGSMGTGDLLIEATVGKDTYYYKKTGGVSLTAGKYYQSTVTMEKPTPINLSALTAGYEAKDGDVLTGTLSGNYEITIADGATVTLDGVTINGENNSACYWAGLTLVGDGTIILSGTNSVKGFYVDFPGIYVPEGKTLTIKGDGSLTASSNGDGAGIGAGMNHACGNITIEGGTITATGGKLSAGIGGSSYTKCGNITITDGVTKVTATKGDEAPNSIGAGYNSSCGTVTIGGTVGAITASPYTYEPDHQP